MERRLVVLGRSTRGNDALVAGFLRLGFDAVLVSPLQALAVARASDVVLARLDVLPTLDGIEEGLHAVAVLERAGMSIVNPARTLRAVHDKLCTARLLAAAGVPHVRTTLVRDIGVLLDLEPPMVLKPRFGSWGRDVIRCRDRTELEVAARKIHHRDWFVKRGVLVEELLPASQTDLRIIVAGGRVVGAAQRHAAPGEWRTNRALGGSVSPADPPTRACELALAAAAASAADFVGADLYPSGDGWIVLELNGAVEFDATYSLEDRDVYADLADALQLEAPAQSFPRAPTTRGGR